MTKAVFFLIGLLVSSAQAQTVTIDRVTRHIGAGTGKVLDTHADVPACLSAVAASAPDGNHRCHVWVTKATAVVVPPAPAPATGPTYYFSDCQTGAAAGCVPGNNANAGTSTSAPKQTLAGFDLNALPAGSRVLFARGGAWINFAAVLRNLNATPAAPIVFDAYGTGPIPTLKTAAGNGFRFGLWNDTQDDGGYVLRNLKLDGLGTATWGVHAYAGVRGLLIENVEITGFELGLHLQNSAQGLTNPTLRNSRIFGNRGMGMLADGNGLVIEGNSFDRNASGTVFDHAIYLNGSGRNGAIRNNTFTNNSVVNGVCTGGNVTVHGQWDGLVIENNTMSQVASAGGCWGFSVTAGYASAEWLRNVVVRGNTVTNLGGCGICATAAPGIVVERNKIINDQPTWQVGISVPVQTAAAGDDANGNAIVRDNVVCFSRPASGSAAANVGAATVNTGNVYRAGADAATGVCAR